MMPIVILKYLKVVFLERIKAVEKFLNCLIDTVLKYVTELSHFSVILAKKTPSLSSSTLLPEMFLVKGENSQVYYPLPAKIGFFYVVPIRGEVRRYFTNKWPLQPISLETFLRPSLVVGQISIGSHFSENPDLR